MSKINLHVSQRNRNATANFVNLIMTSTVLLYFYRMYYTSSTSKKLTYCQTVCILDVCLHLRPGLGNERVYLLCEYQKSKWHMGKLNMIRTEESYLMGEVI